MERVTGHYSSLLFSNFMMIISTQVFLYMHFLLRSLSTFNVILVRFSDKLQSRACFVEKEK